MSWVLAGSAAIGLAPALYKGISGANQVSAGKKMKPVDPGFVMNSGVIDNARVLGDRAGNYTMPGMGAAVNNLGASTAGAFTQGVQGASSGGDVLDLATKLAYGQQQQLNNLSTQNAAGADQALLQSLNANAAAGQEYQNKNAYDRDQYQGQLKEKAALIQGGNENIYGAIDQAAAVGGSLINPVKSISNTGQPALSPQQLKLQQDAYLKMLSGNLGQQNMGMSRGIIA